MNAAATPPAPVVAVGAICMRDGRLLLVRRGHPPGQGRWSVPGGRVEPGETLAAAVRRELREETGLSGDVGALCGVAERIGADHHFVILDFWVTVGDADAAVPGDDADALVWARRRDVERLELVPGLRAWLAAHGVLARLEP